MKFYYVYILRCHDDSLYTGITNDLYKRIDEHNEGKSISSYTYSRRPVVLQFYQQFIEPDQATLFEKKLKKWSKAKKEALIENNYDLIRSLSECRNGTHSKYKPS
jgi:putative endonuclease